MGATAKTIGLFLILIGLFAAIGFGLGNYINFGIEAGGSYIPPWLFGMLIFLVLAAIFNLVSYFLCDKIILWSYRVKIVSEQEYPRLHRIVKKVVERSELPMPRIGIIPMETPNAFATGRNPRNAVVAASEGILKLLNDEELEGVMAHEMAHVKNRDILVMSVAATIAGAIAFAARWGWFSTMFGERDSRGGNPLLMLVLFITMPIAAMMIQFAISRHREYGADYEGAMLIKKPLALASALRKLDAGCKHRPLTNGNPASASLFIVNPFGSTRERTISWFLTHPPIKRRIRKLEELENQLRFGTVGVQRVRLGRTIRI